MAYGFPQYTLSALDSIHHFEFAFRRGRAARLCYLIVGLFAPRPKRKGTDHGKTRVAYR